MLIYPDTNIWDALCDQSVDPKRLVESLALKNKSLLLSFHTVWELAKAFRSKDPKGVARAVQLFTYLRKVLDLAMPCSKQIMDLLLRECYAFEAGLSNIDPLLASLERAALVREVDKLVNGIVDRRVKKIIVRRTGFAWSTRAAQKAHFLRREKLKRKVESIPEDQLARWLKEQTLTPDGAEILCSHLERILGLGLTPDYALGILLSPVGNAARGIVRADLYYSWRCANRGSSPSDLLDDMQHVLQSIYCDFYVTAEPKQSEYASILLTAKTRVALDGRKAPIDQWLEALV